MNGVTAPMWVGLPLGVGFGAIASLWGIGNPETIIRAARLIDRLLPACFLLVTALGSVLLYGLYASGVAMHFSPKPTYIYGVVLGGILFGVGLALSGYLPGTALMAIGEGRRDALLAIPGGLLGASAWTALADTDFGRWIVSDANFGDVVAGGNIHDVSPARMVVLALLYAAAALCALYFLPRYRASRHCCLRSIRGGEPDSYDRQMAIDTHRYLNEGARRPIVRRNTLARLSEHYVTLPGFFVRATILAGSAVAILGVLALFLRQQFGQSTTYSWVVGVLFMRDSAYSQNVFATIGWEPLADLGVLIGAFLSAYLFTGRFTAFAKVTPPSWRNRFGDNPRLRQAAVFGGSFLTLLGARMAGGCTSGHTLSGGIQLSISAWLFTASLAVAAVLTARLVYRDVSCRVDA
ncbi:YeeE/YedE thiosulfate transporter family protein [Mycolicibacterium neoaurum]|uniref:YeeE/YedE thiosulfate transporter family protein n=1 Tax=Mycolicibacterium neoaurum TaxID=1795 RepID=UPI001F4CE4AC|nr:YeeE/YedE thiosulfate transporter family protein [Mycolicibacterium neoaurum]